MKADPDHRPGLVSRRGFLRMGSTTGLGVLALNYTACTPEAPLADGEVLNAGQQAVLKKMIRVFLPTEGSPLPSPEEIRLQENINAFLGTLPSGVVDELKIGLALFNYGSILIGLHFSRFVNLSDADALKYAQSWESGAVPLKKIIGEFKLMIFAFYWQDARTWPPLDYRGPVTKARGIELYGNAPLPVETETLEEVGDVKSH